MEKIVTLKMVSVDERNPSTTGEFPVILDTGEIAVRYFQKGVDGWPDVWVLANEGIDRFPKWWALTISMETL